MTTLVIALVVCVYVLLLAPAYVIAQRSGVRNPWIAFVPILGAWIVLFETIGRSAWLSLLVFVPYIGSLLTLVWIAVEVPRRHWRSGWWTLAFLVPGVNLIAFWWYAFTLPHDAGDLAFAA
jgi:hypothetical protein